MPAIPHAKLVPWADGDALNTTNVNAYLRDPVRFLLLKPICRIRHVTSINIPTGTWTDILFTLEDVDTDPDGIGMHSTAANTSRATARYPGWYGTGGAVSFAVNPTGLRGTRWCVNGTPISGSEIVLPPATGSATTVPARTLDADLDDGDYLTLQGFQNSGASLATNVTSAGGASLETWWQRAKAGQA